MVCTRLGDRSASTVPYLVVLVVVPVGPDGQVALDLGLFFALAVMGVGVIGAIMAGWASANKYSLLVLPARLEPCRSLIAPTANP